ncbi:CHAD domain-containing protein [Streptantibioticus silvisoli]|uniref:CHAD domain-containing protein n=1 Tax=Streptantibioticus silvisoli TaxID=2705255 RepID=UPI003F6BEA10
MPPRPPDAPRATADVPAARPPAPRAGDPAGPPRPLPEGVTAGEVIAGHLAALAVRFLRAVRDRQADEAAAAAALRASGGRIAAALHTWEPLLDPGWARELRPELGWLCEEVTREYRYAARLARLTGALHRLAAGRAAPAGPSAAGAARAGALLERRLTQGRSRARSAALQAYGSGRFHAVADAVALLASDTPLTGRATGPAGQLLPPLAAGACRALADAVAALPLGVAGSPYNTQALHGTLADPAAPAGGTGSTGSGGTGTHGSGDEGQGDGEDPRDTPWHRVRVLARGCRYALEVPGAGPPPPGMPQAAGLYGAGRALDRHRDAAEAAEAAAGAARTPRITPATAYALGVLHADQRTEAEAARYAFSTLWRPTAPATAPSGGPTT